MREDPAKNENEVRAAVLRLFQATAGFSQAYSQWERDDGPERDRRWADLVAAQRDLDEARAHLQAAEMARRRLP